MDLVASELSTMEHRKQKASWPWLSVTSAKYLTGPLDTWSRLIISSPWHCWSRLSVDLFVLLPPSSAAFAFKQRARLPLLSMRRISIYTRLREACLSLTLLNNTPHFETSKLQLQDNSRQFDGYTLDAWQRPLQIHTYGMSWAGVMTTATNQ